MLASDKFCICIFYKSGRSVPNIILIMSGWKVHESHLLHSLLLYVSFQHILQFITFPASTVGRTLLSLYKSIKKSTIFTLIFQPRKILNREFKRA